MSYSVDIRKSHTLDGVCANLCYYCCYSSSACSITNHLDSSLESQCATHFLSRKTSQLSSPSRLDGSSSHAARLLSQQRDIRHLTRQYYPFEEDELTHLYLAYQDDEWMIYGNTSLLGNQSISFLSEYAVRCATSLTSVSRHAPTTEPRRCIERLLQTQLVERNILPAGFGHQLEERIFSLQVDDEKMCNDDAFHGGSPTKDERRTRMERFFEGVAQLTGRKGSRMVLSAIFECCTVAEDRDCKQGAKPLHNVDDASPLLTSFDATSSDPPSRAHIMDQPQQAHAKEIVIFAYRLALAGTFFENFTLSKDGYDNMARFDFEYHDDKQYILAMIASLVEFARTKRARDGSYNGAPTRSSWEEDLLSQDLVTQQDLWEWSESAAPLFPISLSSLMNNIFFPPEEGEPSHPSTAVLSSRTPPTTILFPTLNTMESIFIKHATSPLLFVMASLTKSLAGGTWHRLYTSASDGMSFNRLQNAILGYGGPTLFIIQAVSERNSCTSIFGAYTSSPWKESKDFFGFSIADDHDCFLYQLLPELHVYRPNSSSSFEDAGGRRNRKRSATKNYMYCNSSARGRGYDQQAHGIGFGGYVQQPRLFLDESLEHCYAGCGNGDFTFERGPLFVSSADENHHTSNKSSYFFELDQLEVWGVGSQDVVREALGRRQKQRDLTDASLRKARQVNKAAFLDDFRSGLLESKVFKHRDEIRAGGRTACTLYDG